MDTPFPKPPSRVICLHQADGQPSRGGASCAIKPLHLASIPRQGRWDPRARLFAPIGAKLMRSTTAQIAAVGVGLRRGLGHQQPARNARRISLRSAQRERAAMHRVPRLAAVFGSLHRARSNRLPIAVAVRSPPFEARASPRPRPHANQDVAFCMDQVLRSDSKIRASRRCRSRYNALVIETVHSMQYDVVTKSIFT